MSGVEKDIYTRLTNFAGLTSLISSRTYANIMPQDVADPAITYHIISSITEHAMGSDPGNVSTRLQVDCWGKKYGDAKDVSVQVKAALSRWRGQQTNVYIEDVFIDNEFDDYDSESKSFRTVVDFIVFYRT